MCLSDLAMPRAVNLTAATATFQEARQIGVPLLVKFKNCTMLASQKTSQNPVSPQADLRVERAQSNELIHHSYAYNKYNSPCFKSGLTRFFNIDSCQGKSPHHLSAQYISAAKSRRRCRFVKAR
jgi:hypothetical protein